MDYLQCKTCCLNLSPVNSNAFHDEPRYRGFFSLAQVLALLFQSAIACSPKQRPSSKPPFPWCEQLAFMNIKFTSQVCSRCSLWQVTLKTLDLNSKDSKWPEKKKILFMHSFCTYVWKPNWTYIFPLCTPYLPHILYFTLSYSYFHILSSH